MYSQQHKYQCWVVKSDRQYQMGILQENIGMEASMATTNGHHLNETIKPIFIVNGQNGKIKKQDEIECLKNDVEENREILSYPKKLSRGAGSIIVKSTVPYKRYYF